MSCRALKLNRFKRNFIQMWYFRKICFFIHYTPYEHIIKYFTLLVLMDIKDGFLFHSHSSEAGGVCFFGRNLVNNCRSVIPKAEIHFT